MTHCCVVAIVTLGFVTACGCGSSERRQTLSAQELKAKCLGRVPSDSRGRKPAGTKDDPFIGYGVVIGFREFSPELTRIAVKQKAISYLKTAGEWGAYVPAHFMNGVDSGDFVRLLYALLPEESPLGREYAQVIARGEDRPLPHVFCGYELFKIEAIPDDEFRRATADARR